MNTKPVRGKVTPSPMAHGAGDSTGKMRRQPDALVEPGTKGYVLTRGDEKRVVTTAKEVMEALSDGFKTGSLRDCFEIEDALGVDISGFLRQREVESLKNRFAKNRERQLAYLSGGLDAWYELVNNYWMNRNEYGKVEVALDGLEKQLMEKIKHEIDQIFHYDAKDVKSRAYAVDDYNSRLRANPNIPEEFRLNVKSFNEGIVHEICYKAGEGIRWEGGKLPGRLQPKDAKPRGYHPLLEPFRETLTTLKKDGVTELPDWLLEQGEMAGVSAVYQDISPRLQEWMKESLGIMARYQEFIKEKNIPNAPVFKYLPRIYAEDIAVLDGQIHKR